MSLLSRPRFSLRRPARPWRWAVRVVALVLVVVVGSEVVRVVGGPNRHAVIPGRVYRCSQPTEAHLREMVRDHHIRTVINLRGVSQVQDWYKVEARTLHDLNVSQEDVTFSANRLPPPSELRQLIEVLDHTEYPIVFHCKQGADRTGLTAAVALLLSPDATLSDAMRQLWPRYGHFRFGRTAAIDEFFDLYKAWLNERGHRAQPGAVPPLGADRVHARPGAVGVDVPRPAAQPGAGGQAAGPAGAGDEPVHRAVGAEAGRLRRHSPELRGGQRPVATDRRRSGGAVSCHGRRRASRST